MKSPRTILLVEDDFLTSFAQRRKLEEAGYGTITAASGEQAVHAVGNSERIDLVLMDIDLGAGMDGTAAAAEILKLRDLPILFLSSHSEPAVVERTEAISSYGYVMKGSEFSVLDASMKMAFKLFAANQKCARSEERFRTTFSAVNDGLWEVDFSTGLAYLSPVFYRLLGFEKDEFPPTAAHLRTLIHPGDLGHVEGSLIESAGTGMSFEIELRLMTKGGEWTWVSARGRRAEEGSGHEGPRLTGTLSSIAERKRAERNLVESETRYRRLFETAQDGILILDAETGRIVDVNPFLMDMLGYSREEFVERSIWDIGAFKDIVASRNSFSELQRNGYVRYEDLPLETRNGGVRAVEFISNTYLVDGHRVIQCNIRDISDRKRAEQLELTLGAERELLLKEVHHRVKNNMATLDSLLALQLEVLSDPLARKALRDTSSRIQTMMILYDRLYRSTSYASLDIADYLGPLIENIVDQFSSRDRVTVLQDYDKIELDAGKLQTLGIIINELITNTMKYAFEGISRCEVRISAAIVDGVVTLEIADNGVGMPVSAPSTEPKGFGLFLIDALTRQIGATLRIVSGGGTKVSISFPRGMSPPTFKPPID